MFARVSSLLVFILFALPLLAAATALPRADGTPVPASSCNTGDLQCCSSTQSTNSTITNLLTGLLGIVLPEIGALIGLTCSPISIIGLGGTSCTQQPVCCSDNSFGGLISLGCMPVNLNL